MRYDDIIIGDDIRDNDPGLHRASCGLVARDFGSEPVGSVEGLEAPSGIINIPWHEFPERIRDREASKTNLLTIRDTYLGGKPIPSLYQNGEGYCWAYAPTIAHMLLRMRNNLPYARLSAHAVGAKIMGFANRGAWGAKALDFITKYGQPTTEFWAEPDERYDHETNRRKTMARPNDNPQTWANALQYRIAEGWSEMQSPEWDRNMTIQAQMSVLVTGGVICGDYDWWGHAVCLADLVDVHPQKDPADPSRYGPRIWNSHGDGFGTRGVVVLADRKAWPNNAVAPRSPGIFLAKAA